MANIFDEDRLLFRERPDWADLTPLEQYENLTPIAPILYSEECKQRSFSFSIFCILNVVLL
jgi:protein farnesyltransferase/geranylgeranyltransferase type-1 subunit alpha